MVDMATGLLGTLCVLQAAQIGFEAKLLSNQSSMQSKVRAMWADYKHKRADQ